MDYDWKTKTAQDLLTARRILESLTSNSGAETLSRLARTNGYNILRDALKKGFTDVAKEMLNFGVRVNNVTENADDSPLHFAALNGYADIVQVLLSKGAETNAINKIGETPLLLAVKGNNDDIIRLLLTNNAVVNAILSEVDSPLHIAALKCNKDIVELLLSKGANINATNKTGETPLFLAVKHNNVEIVRLLVTNNADVNAKSNYEGMTPLHFTVHSYSSRSKETAGEIARLLLNAGANVNAETTTRQTPLLVAVKMGETKVVEVLLEFKADVDVCGDWETPLIESVNRGYAEITKMLLKIGAEVNARCTRDKRTLLHRAVKNCRESVVKVLLSMPGIEVDLKTDEGDTALHIAAATGHERIVEALIEKGADINIKDVKGKLPLQIALEMYTDCDFEKSTDFFASFLNSYTDVNSKNESGKTPLHYAVETDLIAFISVLLNHGAEINLRDHLGRAPLHYAALNASSGSAVRCLLEHGANINLQDNKGQTPFQIALEYGDESSVLEFIIHGADTKVKDDCGKTPLHYAVTRGMKLVLSVLLNLGENVNSKDIEGKTPLHLCAEIYYYEHAALSGDLEYYSVERVEVEKGHCVLSSPLLVHGADVDCITKCGKSALHLAAEKGRVDVVMALLKYGADVNIRANVFPNHTPLKCSKSTAVIEKLQEHIVMLSALNLPVDEMNLESIDFNVSWVQEFKTLCDTEIYRSKKVNLVNGDKRISFYDILTKNRKNMYSFLKSGMSWDVSEFLSLYKFRNFPIFGDMIARHLRLAVERITLMPEITVLLGDLFCIPPGICVEALTNYLRNTDLKSFITACRLTEN